MGSGDSCAASVFRGRPRVIHGARAASRASAGERPPSRAYSASVMEFVAPRIHNRPSTAQLQERLDFAAHTRSGAGYAELLAFARPDRLTRKCTLAVPDIRRLPEPSSGWLRLRSYLSKLL